MLVKRNLKSLKRTLIKKRGPLSEKWEKFRNEEFEKDKDEEGLIKCQCHLIGLPRCGIALPDMDLHHIKGRNEAPALYFEKTNLVWLTKQCHRRVHNQI